MGYSYDECEDIDFTKAEVIQEINKHDLDPADFFSKYGDRDEYNGGDVLSWLGY